MDDFISESAQAMRNRFTKWITALYEHAKTLDSDTYIDEQYLIHPDNLDLHGDFDPANRYKLAKWINFKREYKVFCQRNKQKKNLLSTYFALLTQWNTYEERMNEFREYEASPERQRQLEAYRLATSQYTEAWDRYEKSGTLTKVKHLFHRSTYEMVYTLDKPTLPQPMFPQPSISQPFEPRTALPKTEPRVDEDTVWRKAFPLDFGPVDYMIKMVYGRTKGMDAVDAVPQDDIWAQRKERFFRSMGLTTDDYIPTH
jgi:hypothetical protein